MKELDLYKFVTKNDIEYHWQDEDVIMFVYCRDIEKFNKLFNSFSLNEGGIECHMEEGFFAFWMKGICENNDIELDRVFANNDGNE